MFLLDLHQFLVLLEHPDVVNQSFQLLILFGGYFFYNYVFILNFLFQSPDPDLVLVLDFVDGALEVAAGTVLQQHPERPPDLGLNDQAVADMSQTVVQHLIKPRSVDK